jgi:homoserine kinase
VRTVAPATTANLGPGFDCAAVALDLWNEVEVTEGADRPPDPEHLGVRAFGLVASPDGLSFEWIDRVPRASGLGSSAATIALGLVAAMKWTGQDLALEDLLARGMPLEGHADNLSACLAGGACLTWSGRIARIADDLPLTPVVVVPQTPVLTSEARLVLPPHVRHADASFNVARAALLGAGLAQGDAALLAAAFADRLHEPYRTSPLLASIRADLPSGAVGATLSGSGPTVVAWATDAAPCAKELEERFPEETVMVLPVSGQGAH